VKSISIKPIPTYFRPILWSYDFEKLDPQKNERDIILNTINYGNLIHWFWISEKYGKTEVWRIVNQSGPSKLRSGARRLAEIMFGKNNE